MTYDKMRQDYERMRKADKNRIVDEWKAANGYNDLLAAYSASVSEADRLRKLFDGAGHGEHNVLALIDHYQRNSMEADERIRAVRKLLEENGCDCPAVRKLLEENGCDCPCDHHPDERGDDYLARRRAAHEAPPYVCPGCHAVAPDRCVPGCFDDEIETEHRHAIESGDYDDEIEEARRAETKP